MSRSLEKLYEIIKKCQRTKRKSSKRELRHKVWLMAVQMPAESLAKMKGVFRGGE